MIYQIELTEEMILRASKAIHDMGGIYFNPHVSSESEYTVQAEEILKAALFGIFDEN